MSQDYRKTLLIVCEGERSEPDYFHSLRNEVIEKCGSNLFIKILPIPAQEKIDDDLENFELRKGAKKKQIKETATQVEDFIIEEEFKAQPTRYVRKAQLAHLESNYDELWAVYDRDGHPNHEEAFNLSKPDAQFEKIVNIGFSSISFEMWLLLHFEYSTQSFNKSQCRNAQKEVFYCGNGVHAEDCKGFNCVIGHIVSSGHLEYTNSKFFEYNKYNSYYSAALNNAISLRESINSNIPFYNLNPYISVDKLVFKLKYFDKLDHIWIEESSFIIDNNIECVLEKNNSIANVIVTNKSNTAYILEESLIYLIDVEYNILKSCARKFMQPQEENTFSFEIDTENFSYLIVKTAIDEGFVFDKDFIKKL